MSDEQQLGVAEARQALREIVQIRPRRVTQLVRVEVEQETALERDDETFADAGDGGAGDGLLNLFRLLIHLMTDDRAGGAAYGRADDRTARRGTGGVADD